jgi:hypothetical protein
MGPAADFKMFLQDKNPLPIQGQKSGASETANTGSDDDGVEGFVCQVGAVIIPFFHHNLKSKIVVKYPDRVAI